MCQTKVIPQTQKPNPVPRKEYSHTVQGGPVPVRPLVGLLRHLLHVVEEDEAAGRLYREHHEADDDLEDATDQAAHVTEQDADAVPQAEQDADWKEGQWWNLDNFFEMFYSQRNPCNIIE